MAKKKKTTLKRAYKGKDVEMLTVCDTMIDQAIIYKATLIAKRTTWADPFFPNLKTRIADAFSNYLGIDNAQQMRDATQIVTGIQQNATRDLAEFKIQVEEDFKKDKKRLKEILTRLGFTAHHKTAQRGDQEAMIELLLQFKKNMTTTLQNEITAKGTALNLITAIIGYADTLKNSNITQETMKGSRKIITQEAVTEFNEIYNQVISVAKIAAKFFKGDKAKQDLFSYKKGLENLNQTRNTPPQPPTTP